MFDEESRNSFVLSLVADHLHPELERHGFEVEAKRWIDVSDFRFAIRYKKKMISLYGDSYEHRIEFVGFPVGNSLILCYGMIEGSEEVDAKIKIRSTESVADIVHRFKYQFIYKLIEKMSTQLSDLPLEIKLLICTHLTVEDIARLSLVNREWNMICTVEEALWKYFLLKDFPNETEMMMRRPLKILSWRSVYREVYTRRKRCWEERGLEGPIPLLALPDIPRPLPIAPPHPALLALPYYY